MRAVDTNVLVYAEITTSTFHSVAKALLTEMAEGATPWAIPWPCLYEFLRVVTHPRVAAPPVPLSIAMEDLRRILQSPTLMLLSETARHSEVVERVIRETRVTGNLIHDAHIAALCIEHAVSELVTGDGDFSRFPLRIVNPFH